MLQMGSNEVIAPLNMILDQDFKKHNDLPKILKFFVARILISFTG